ncbi:MAG: hypothetical protein HYZ49_06150 [Chloroflexi bacterium]|nr:hypothetical protein [Chloroflexota bacterium]
MKCPNCNHVSTTALFKCSSCGETYDRSALEKLEHLDYVLAWLDEQAKDLRPDIYTVLRSTAAKQLEATRARLPAAPALPTPAKLAVASQPPPVSTFPLADQGVVRALGLVEATRQLIPAWTNAGIISIASAGKLSHHLATRAEELRGKLAGQTINLEPPDELRVLEFVLGSVERWAEGGHIAPDEAKTLLGNLKLKRTALMQGAPLTPTPATPAPAPALAASSAAPVAPPIHPPKKVVVPASVASQPAPAAAPAAPAKPAKPPAPPIDWSKIWEKAWGLVVSGALLRGLLYLGAFMIVVSAIVLVVAYWQFFHPLLKLGFIAAVPLTFYASGFFMRARLKLPEAGGVFTGIGALLVAVDFAAVYQIGGLRGQVDVYWLIASVFCTALYTFTAWRVRGEFFAYITLIGATSTLLAFTSLLGLPLEWWIASAAASAVGMLVAASPLKRQGGGWRDLAQATRHLPQLLLPVSMFLVLPVPGNSAFGQMAVFLFAAVGYGLLASAFPAVFFAHASIWSSIGAVMLGLRASPLPVEWYATVAATLAPVYILAGRALYQRLPDFAPPRNRYRGAANLAGFGLLVVAIVTGAVTLLFVDLWAGITALALAALVLGWCAYFFRRSAFAFFAAGLFIAPFMLAVDQWLVYLEAGQGGAWLASAGAGLALIYLATAALLRRADKYAMWLHLWAHALAPLAVLGLLINYAITADSWFNIPSLVALTGVLAVYVASAVIHDSGGHPGLSNFVNWLPSDIQQDIFLWPIGLLIPIWIGVAGWGTNIARPWFGVVLAALALVYVGGGQLLALRKAAYRFPPHVYAYLLVVVGIAVALNDKLALVATLYIAVAVMASLAALYRRVAESAIAAALFIWPFQLTLQLSPLTPHAYSLAYALLASAGYIPLGLLLDWRGKGKFQTQPYTIPLYVVGHSLAALAVLASLAGRLGAYEINVKWIGVAVPLIVSGLQALSLYRFQKFPFAWATAALFPIAFGQAFTWLSVPPKYDAAAWVLLAFVYMLVERGLVINVEAGSIVDALRARSQNFRWPFGLGAAALCALGLALTAYELTYAFLIRPALATDYASLILAQGLAVGFVVLAARLYHSRWPLFVEPALAFIPFTLFFFAYGERLFGQALTLSQFSVVWPALAIAHLLAALLLDRNKVRYSHGLYLGGYSLTGFALLWSVLAGDRVINLYALAVAIVVSLASHTLAHYGHHHSFGDLIHFIWPYQKRPASVLQRAARTIFLFVTAYAVPVWLAQFMAYLQVPLAWRGLGLALAAPIYIAFGLAARRVRAEYTWPLYSAGYALTAIGAMMAFDDLVIAIYVLALNTVVYAASAYIFRQAFWLYLANALVPIVALLTLSHNDALTAPWVSGIFMALAFVYFGLGQLFNRRKTSEVLRDFGSLSPFALAFFAPGYLLSAIALAVASGDRLLAIEVYSAGVVLYALSAWAFRETVFLYPAAWLAAVPYYLGMTLAIPPGWYGLGWLPLIVGYIVIGRFVFHKRPLGGLKDSLTHPALPFYLLAYALSLSMMILSQADALTFTLALAAGAVIYFASAALFRRFAWLYPALLAAHVGLLSFFAINPSNLPPQYIALPFLGFTWLVALVGYIFSRRQGEGRLVSLSPCLRYLLTPSWSQPFFIFTALDVIFWQAVALGRYETAIIVAVGFAILLGLFATLWSDGMLPYFTFGFFLLATGYHLSWAHVSLADSSVVISGIGFGLYLLAQIAALAAGPSPVVKQHTTGEGRVIPLNIWIKPLTNVAMTLTGLAVVATVPFALSNTTATAFALAFAGALYLTVAYRGRHYRLGYTAMAMLQVAWALLLIKQNLVEPQLYAIPAGLYFGGVGFLERRRGRKWFALVVESFGLAVLLLTSFIQSLNGGAAGLPHFVIMLVEGLLVIWWGAARRLKAPFFIGVTASALNVAGQVVVLFGGGSTLIRWLIILSAGLLFVTAAVFVERQRVRIIARAQEWRVALETWE